MALASVLGLYPQPSRMTRTRGLGRVTSEIYHGGESMDPSGHLPKEIPMELRTSWRLVRDLPPMQLTSGPSQFAVLCRARLAHTVPLQSRSVLPCPDGLENLSV